MMKGSQNASVDPAMREQKSFSSSHRHRGAFFVGFRSASFDLAFASGFFSGSSKDASRVYIYATLQVKERP